ncbi:MAG: mechanosensitive ion channel family protein, partial [Acidobacteria bacterium]|nr:mechanosensitive ion channel family protein [Acidobacteriota bacterium]
MTSLLSQAAQASEQGTGPAEAGILDVIRDAVVGLTGDGGWTTWALVFVLVFAALVFDFAQRKLLGRLKKRLERTKTPWDDAILDSLTAPISLLIWVLGITLAATFLDLETRLMSNVISLTLVAAMAWFLLRLIKNGQANLLEASRQTEDERDRLDPSTVEAIGKLLRLAVGITAILIGLQQIGVNISAILAFGGIGGIAIGFAAKDLLANFFGGLMIYMDRPFKVGDWIRSPDRNIEGTVESIGWRLTRIRTFDKRPLYLPNSIFATIAVENPQRMLNRRIYETIGLRYDDIGKMDDITREVKAMLQGHPEIDTNQTLMVNFNSFGPSSIDFFVYTLTKTTNWQRFHEIKHEILLKIAGIIT